ncbi:MAG: DUF2490 domain-containing protein [Methylococcaceae bacterium]|nr:DUF2490 domain-containing protein [Methylococcaceae bacterium]MDP2394584.1 DUF2490 domain-containing protein [Methylococcaceae bacterium]MDP3019052.1 DUF2490 domain-containing protein [Methylococcaceae bacterium]MDP3390268.1 DUF2490 domain-containing protein [Methylococcaceae bacterium]MDZ4156323.1 DUF2490 domain-containing protein [Methylococcales bacterium]
MNNIKKTVVLSALLLIQSISAFAGGTDTDAMRGGWGALALHVDFKPLSPNLEKLKWSVLNHTSTRDDSPKGTRKTENLLFSHVGYQLNDNASLWLGYLHDSINPLDKPSYQKNRHYQDFQWNQKLGDWPVPIWKNELCRITSVHRLMYTVPGSHHKSATHCRFWMA